MNRPKGLHLRRLWAFRATLFTLVVALAAGCRAPQAAPKPTDSGITPAPTVEVTLPPTVEPATTPTPARRDVILLALPGADAAQVQAFQQALGELSAAEGLTFQTRQEPLANVNETARLVVVLPPDPGVSDLAAANPQVQFLAVGLAGGQANQNLSVVASGGERPDRQGFIAGYLAAIMTPDWRAGVISVPDTPAEKAARNGFYNGLVFYCGLCRPAYPPFVQYPVFIDLPATAGGPEFAAAIATLTGNGVKTVYIAPGAASTELVELLAQGGLQIIGSGNPAVSSTGAWVASVTLDSLAAVRDLWPRLMAGENALSVDVPLTLAHRNEELFSSGRLRVVEEKLADLLAGYIDTGIDPATGERR